MSLIDAKGKLFGMINVIDLFALLLFVLLIVGLYQCTSRAETKEPLLTTVHVPITLKLAEPAIETYVAVGDAETAGDIQFAQITDKKVQQNVQQENESVVSDVYLTILLTGYRREGRIFYRDNPLMIGQSFSMQTDKAVITGIIVDIGREP